MISFHNSTKDKVMPKRNNTVALDEFLNSKIGMFISFGLTTYTPSDIYTVNYLLDPYAPSTFSAPSTVDSAQWATEAANLGCGYAFLTTGHHIGFNIFPYTAAYNKNSSENTYDSNRGLLSVPVYKRYDVSVTDSDQNIIGKFIDQCIVEGIKSGLYYNIGKNINMRRGLDLIDASYDQTNTYSLTYQNYIDFCAKELEYISKEFSPDYIWMDAPHHAPRYYGNDRQRKRYIEDLYYAVKKHSPNTLVFVNYDCPVIDGNREVLPNGTDSTRPPFTWDGSELNVFPGDVISFEHLRVPSDSGEYNPVTSHEGINYYLPREIISTIYSNNQYFARNDSFGALKSAVTLQAEYDEAKTNNVPYMLNLAVNTSGNLRAVDITRFGEIVL